MMEEVARSQAPHPEQIVGLQEAVRSIIEARWQDYASMAGASCSTNTPREEPSLRCENSLIMQFEFPGEPVRTGFVVKLGRSHTAVKSAEAEYEHLKRLHQQFGAASPFRVPQPFDYIPEFDALVMERVFAPRLDQLLRFGARRWSRLHLPELLDPYRRAGRWLRTLVSSSVPDTPATSLMTADFSQAWTDELESVLARASALGLPRWLHDHFRAAFADPRGHLHGRPTAVHSDFTPYNVHAAADALYVTDFAEMPLGFGNQSAAFFWAWLEVARTSLRLSDDTLTQCQLAFHDGFGQQLSPFWETWGLLRQYSYMPNPASVSRSRRWWHRWRLNRLQAALATRARAL